MGVFGREGCAVGSLFKYIESNPIKAKITQKIGDYIYCATYSILKDAVPLFLQNSFVLRDYNTKELLECLSIPLSDAERLHIDAFHKIKYKQEDGQIVPLNQEKLSNFFLHVKNKSERNDAIQKAYTMSYTKSEIARHLSLSVAGVSKILKKLKV